MSKYYKAEDVLAIFSEEERPLNWTDSESEIQAENDFDDYKEMIENLPTTNIVHCKDCKWWREYPDYKGEYFCGKEHGLAGDTNADDYCSRGDEKLECMNCRIGDFKFARCDCDNGFCKEFKGIGEQEDFINAVMQRIRPQGEWIKTDVCTYRCSICGKKQIADDTNELHYCCNCGSKNERTEK